MITESHFKLSHPMFMISENDCNIIKITMTMHGYYSEYSNYIAEMTITIPSAGVPEISINNPADYSNALEQMLKNQNRDYCCEGK